MTDTEVQGIFSDVYNVFWNKWKRVPITMDSDKEWDEIIQDASSLLGKYNESPMIVAIINAVLDELDERAKENGKKNNR